MKLSPGFHQVFKYHQVFITKKTWWIHQVFTKFINLTRFSPKFTKNLVNSFTKKLGEFIKLPPGFHQVLKFHQVFTRAKKNPGEFTRFSPGFQISPSFHHKKKLGEFTRFSPGFEISPSFHHQKKLGEFTRVFTRASNFTKFSQKKSWWIHQVFTRFSNYQVFTKKKTWWIHQVFTKFWNFTSFQVNSPSCHLGDFFLQIHRQNG